MEAIANFFVSTGFYQFFQGDNWKSAIMLVIAVVLLFLGIVKKFEPLLLVPIAFGMLVTNLPGAEMFHEILFAGGHVHWDLFGGQPITAQFLSEMLANGVSADMLQPYADALMTAAQSTFDPGVLDNLMAQLAASGSEAVGTLSNQLDALVTAEQYLASYGMTLSNVTVSVGLIDVLYLGIKLGIYPCLIFMGVGAMTDFGPLLAAPRTLLLGAAAQVGVAATFFMALFMRFSPEEAASIGIIGGADGPTSIFLTMKLAPHLLGAVAVAAAAVLLLVRKANQTGAPLCAELIYGDSNTKLTFSLEKDADYDVDTGYLTVHIRIQDGAARFVDSPCPDHICESFGWLSEEDQTATCLPARAVLSIIPTT